MLVVPVSRDAGANALAPTEETQITATSAKIRCFIMIGVSFVRKTAVAVAGAFGSGCIPPILTNVPPYQEVPSLLMALLACVTLGHHPREPTFLPPMRPRS